MAEVDFERRLERLFAEGPELADAGAFAERVERRLDAGWTGAPLADRLRGRRGRRDRREPADGLTQFQRVETAGDSARLISTGFNRISTQADWLSVASAGGVGVWIAAAAAVVMMGFVLTRVIGEI